MADPLSITASILAVVIAGFKAAKGLYQLADGIGSAGMEARIYAEEINSFSKLLQRTREQITQRSEQISSFEENLLREITNICDRVIRPINGIQESLNPILVRFRSSPSKLRSFGLRVQWMFCSKDKLLFYRGALRGQHRLLDTTLALMILQYTKDRSPQNIYLLQISLENSVTEIRHALNSSRQFITANGDSSSLPGLRSASPLDNQVQENNNTDSHQIEALQHRPAGHEEPSSTSLVPSSSVFEPSSQLDEEETLVEGILEEDFENSAQDLWEDMRVVSRKVLRYASNVLRSTSHETTLSDEGLAALDVEIPPAETAPVTPPVGSNSAERTTERVLEPNRDSQGAELVEIQSSNRKVDSRADHIYFKHQDGASYMIPSTSVQHWDSMRNFLSSIYPYVHNETDSRTMSARQLSEKQSDAIGAGAYILLGPQRHRINPEYWYDLITPQWEIQLLFNDPQLNLKTISNQLEGEKR